jgi:DNA mismatch repair protein MutS
MSLNPEGASPAMAQWFALKAEHPDALLFFRMGDFFEMFFADAEAAASALDIALTHRGEHGGAPIPMCGVPVATADLYLARLIRRGFRVAVAEQMEEASARAAKGPLKRAIVRLITPGTLTEESMLDSAQPNVLLALAHTGSTLGAAWLDISTGIFETAAIGLEKLPALLGRLDPAEILAPDTLALGDFASRRASPMAVQAPAAARRRLADAFGVASLEAFGAFSDAEAAAAALALDYVRLTQAGRLPRLSHPTPSGESGQMEMDAATRASLELLRARDGGTALTLFSAVNRTLSAPGARLLAGWIAAPLLDPAAVASRQDSWVFLNTEQPMLAELRKLVRGAPDMARALARISLGRGSPRDLAAIRQGLAASAACARLLDRPRPAGLSKILCHLEGVPDLAALLSRALVETPPLRLDEGGVIASGFDGELDAERALRDDSRRVIASLQLDFAQRFGVASLKIKHHAQLGYVIEVPTAGVEILRAHGELTLRQGMANGARFTHAELSDLDRRINEAAERAGARERRIFATLVQAALAQADPVVAAASALAELDAQQACARLAEGGDWCRPEVTDTSAFCVRSGRHPVVEGAIAGKAAFVPNACDLSPDRRVLLLTGPNMAGKSTYLRQNALIAILAQAGLPVPAASAEIGIVDRLFSRVGAADELARGRSTFMVEMIETAAILHQAGPKSLVIVDEIGRGTATLDGLAIAWAVLEALHHQIRCRTIFATHFHELARLTELLPRLRPHMMRVREWRGDVVFLHEVAEGAAGRSWGVHVARLAGVPAPVVKRAGALLSALEKGREPVIADLPLFASLQVAPEKRHPVLDLLDDIDPDAMSAREALETIYRLKLAARQAGGDVPSPSDPPAFPGA